MVFFSVMLIGPTVVSAQTRGSEVPKNPPPPPAVKRGISPKVQPPLTLRQVIESLSSLRNSSKVENLVSTRGIQFQATPEVLDILKDFGANAKLLSAISASSLPLNEPPAPKVEAPVNKVAGPLNVVCEPKDCTVIADSHSALTMQNKTTITGLKPGDVVVQAFADGYESATQKIQLAENRSSELKFRLKRTDVSRRQAASASIVKSLAALGGMDGMAEFADLEGDGVVNWTDSAGKPQEWPMTFRKRIGKDLRIIFKTKEGQCTASISGASTKQECKSNLKGSGENLAAQATSLFLSYQLQDVMQTLMNRPLIAAEAGDDHLESPGDRDVYSLTLDPSGLPAALIYQSDQGKTDIPIEVQYSNYLKLNQARYPGHVAIGRMNSAPVFVFTITSIHSNAIASKD